jgi:hypothetical protein
LGRVERSEGRKIPFDNLDKNAVGREWLNRAVILRCNVLFSDLSDYGVVDVATVDDALMNDEMTEALGAKTMTVRVEVEVRPDWSVATYAMVSVAASVVSMTMLLVSVPLRNVVMPRLRSPCGSVMVAPRSLYEAPIWTIAGFAPLTEMTGGDSGVLLADAVLLLVAGAVERWPEARRQFFARYGRARRRHISAKIFA